MTDPNLINALESIKDSICTLGLRLDFVLAGIVIAIIANFVMRK